MNKVQLFTAAAVFGFGTLFSPIVQAAEEAVPTEEITEALETEGGTVFPIGKSNDW